MQISSRSSRPTRRHLARASFVLLATLALIALSASGAFAATFTVNATNDAVDGMPGDGICATGASACTLRAAVQEANALPGQDTITVPAGVYALAIAPGGGNDADGDLEISSPLVVQGAGFGATFIDGSGLDRVLEVTETAGNVTLSGLTVRDGATEEEGGAIYSATPGTLRLQGVWVTTSISAGDGGGIHLVTGTLAVAGASTITGNSARTGGGIYAGGEPTEIGLPSRVTLTGTAVVDNTAEGEGGGLYAGGETTVTLDGADIEDNFAGASGGGAVASGRTALTVAGATIAGNDAHADGGGLVTSSERPVSISGTSVTGNAAGVPVAGEAGEGNGGGLVLAGGGSINFTGGSVVGNEAAGEGGGILVENLSSVAISGTAVRANEAGAGGGGIENAGARVALTGMTISDNVSGADGGGIESQGSGDFSVTDSMIVGNRAANGGGFANQADGGTRISRTTFWDNRAVLVAGAEEAGLGGGVFSQGDAGALYENVTITGNVAPARGGGLYVDADAGVRVVHSTIAGNSAPVASGVGGEIGSVNFPVQPSQSVIFKNSIIAGNVLGPGCSFAIGSEGGNIAGDTSCFLTGPNDRSNLDPELDALADNGGPTLTMRLRPGSLAIDNGVAPASSTDQRGISRPQNIAADSGAFESQGPFPPADDTPPDTAYLEGPFQDTENTSVFRFAGTDNLTPVDQLLFECRLIEGDPTEPPEPVDPTEPVVPEFLFVGCEDPWQVPLVEEGQFTFEVRAIDRAGNIDPTPAVHVFGGTVDVVPPQTVILDGPVNGSTTTATTATFTFSATDNATPPQFMEYECRLDTNDPAAWLECTNPAVYSNLAPGQHTFQVRATDGFDNIDPTPATVTWTVGAPDNCEAGNITLTAVEDAHVDEALPLDNFGTAFGMIVRSQSPGEDARTYVRFALPPGPAGCTLQTAALRLYSEGEAGRTLQAIPVDEAWSESQITWNTQPAAAGAAATTGSGVAYRQWNVTSAVTAMYAGTPNHGWVIRDAAEEDALGAEQTLASSESDNVPSTPPQLILRYDDSGIPAPPAPSPAPAPSAVECGDVITQSTTLADDLIGCLGEGLVIGAPNVVLDLNGHTISSGAVVEPGEEDGLLAGIRNSGHANVVIRDGTVTGFGYGVRLMAGTRFNVVEGMTLRGNVNAGIELLDADDGRNGNTISENTLALNGAGIIVSAGSENSRIIDNTFSGNAGLAIEMIDSSGHRIEGNAISGLTNDPLLDSDGGIRLEGSSDNEIVENRVSDAGDAAVQILLGSNDNLLARNVAVRSSDSGLTVNESDGTRVIDNVFHLTGGAGISLGSANDGEIVGNDVRFNPGGIDVGGSSGNIIEGNDARQSGAEGISVGTGSLANRIAGNLVSFTGASGISLEGDALPGQDGNVVEANVANGNNGDGIAVVGVGHTITGNEAHNNLAWGITAEPGNTDGGGNTASGNAEPEQCTGVVCTAGAVPPPSQPDLVNPDTAILTSPASGSSTLSPQTFTFTGSDNFAPETALRFECRLDAPPDPPAPEPEPGEPPQPPDVDNWTECGSPLIYSLLSAGEHTFEVRAVDPSDNVDLTPATYTWTVVAAPPGDDAIAPTTEFVETPTDPSTDSTPTFTFRGSDNQTPGPSLAYECSLDGAPFTTCASPAELGALPLGEHTFSVRSRDLAGNVDESPETLTWAIEEAPADTTPPGTTILSGPDLTTVATSAAFTFTSDDATAIFECAIDDGPFGLCVSPVEYAGLGVGEHTFEVRAVDPAGNDDDSAATYTWTIGPAPVPGAVSCGQTITQSTRLTNDLLDCPGDGLVIGASGITLDLGGHTIDGTDLGVGVRNDGFDSVTVTDGTITGFDVGVQFGPGTANSIASGLTLQLNPTAGVQLVGAHEEGVGNVVRNSSSAGNGYGIALIGGTRDAFVHDNEVVGNAGEGVFVEASHGNRIARNSVGGAGDAGLRLIGATDNELVANDVFGTSDGALIVELGSHRTLLEGNTVEESEAGIDLSESDGSRIIGNVVRGVSDVGISLETANDGLVRGNDVRLNSEGIAVSGSSGNRIESNDASESDGPGIEIGDFSYENVVLMNLASFNAGSGISVAGDAAPGQGNLIDRNTADGNRSGGLMVEGLGHVVAGNGANDNEGWGIYASAGTIAGVNIDGGGNRASGNTELAQCFTIRCDGGTPAPADQVPPETTLVSGPADPTSSRTATFTFEGSDNATAVTFECRIDSSAPADFVDCASPRTYTGLALGSHTVEIRAVDYLGNADPTPIVHTWLVVPPAPGVPPDTTIDSGPDPTTVSTSAAFALSSNEDEVTFECSLDGAAFAPCASPATFTGLAPGAHTLEVRATDGDGLTDPTPASYSWTVGAAPVATAVSCGQTITQSIRLTSGLTDCGGNGLVVGASGITIDLNGQVIDGTGLGAGVLVNGFDSVTVLNGTLQESDFGVQVTGGADTAIVSGVTVQANQEAGVAVSGGTGSTVRASDALENAGPGILLIDGATAALVTGNTLARNSGEGVRVENADGNRVVSNTIGESSEAGIALVGADSTTVLSNALSNNSGGGIVIGEPELPSNDNRIERNTLTGGSGGIEVVESSGNEIVSNKVSGAGGAGVSLEGATDTLVRSNDVRGNSGGVELNLSSGNVIESNNASGANGTGISLEGQSNGNVIALNTANGNSGEGIAVNDAAPAGQGNLIDRNTANGNGGSGILINAAVHTVTGNTVNSNDGWGILAAPGTINGGGNTAAGNAEPAQCSGITCTIGVAPGAPDTSIVERPTDPSTSRNALFTFTGSDDTTAVFDLGFECRLDSTSDLDWVECENPAEYTNLAPGDHRFEVRAVDAAENVDPSPAVWEWTYVALPPGVAPDTFIDQSLAPPAQSPLFEALFVFSSNEPDVTYQCSLDGAAYAPCAFAVEYAFEEFEVGTHTFRVRAIDAEGNIDPTPATYTWTITGVLTTISAGPAFEPGAEPGEPASGGETESTSATFEFAANVPDATYACSLDLAQFTPCTSPVTYDNLAVGEHTLRIVATDPETGAEELEPAEYSWTVLPSLDTTPPNTSITTLVATDPNGALTFAFTGTDNVTSPQGLAFECSLDDPADVAFTECISPLTLPNPDAPEPIAPGDHVLYVRAIDVEDNIDATPASLPFSYDGDTVDPQVTIQTGPPATTGATSATLTFASPDPFAIIECAVNGEPFAECTTPLELTGLEPGPQSVQIRATDLSGNVGDVVTRTWDVVAAPDTTLVTTPPAISTEPTATFTFTSDQPDTTFVCTLDGVAYTPCVSPVELTGLAGGMHEFTVAARNAFGLTDPEPELFEWTVDLPPPTFPETTITSAPPATTSSTTATIAFTSDTPGATFECSYLEGPFTPCTSPFERSGLTPGEYTLEVRAVDGTAVDPTPASVEWEVLPPDTVAPQTAIGATPPATTSETTATFTFTTSEPGSTFACVLDGGTAAACESPVTFNGLAVGSHTLEVRATDAAGNQDATPASFTWTVTSPADTTAPQTAIGTTPPATTSETSATFTFTASETGSTFACVLDGTAAACESPVTFNGLAVGSHTLEVRATDAAGNQDATPASFTWTVTPPADTTAPQTTIGSTPPASTTSTTAGFTFSSSEAGSTFSCLLDGAAVPSCTSPLSLTGLAVGSHTLQVTATDAAGNADPTPATFTWTVQAPACTTATSTLAAAADSWILQDSSGSNYGNDSTLKVTSKSGANARALLRFTLPALGSGCTVTGATLRVYNGSPKSGRTVQALRANAAWSEGGVTWGNQPATTGTPATASTPSNATWMQWNVTSLVQGMYSGTNNGFLLRDATEGNGGIEQGFHSREKAPDNPPQLVLTIGAGTPPPPADTTAPNTTIGSAPSSGTTETSASVAFTSSETGSTFACRIDGGAWATCTSPRSWTGLAVGSHTVEVRATDAAGNTDASPASHTWTIAAPAPPADTTAPNTTIGSAPSSGTTETSASVAFTSSETGSTFECRIDGGAWATCTSPRNWTGLSVGSHTVEVRATDAANNTDASPASHTWTIAAPAPPADTTAPNTTIGSAPSSGTTETSASVAFTSSETGSTFACRIDGGAWGTCTSPRSWTGLSVGSHTVEVRATDAANNTDASPASHTWTIAAPAPPPACTTSTATLAANADSWILQSSSGSNYGTDSVLKVTAKSGANSRALVRFALPAIPAGCTITSAQLRVYNGSPKSGRTIQALRVNASWTESGVTWTNQPATTGTAATATTGSSATWMQWNVTSLVQAQYSGANNGFLLRDATESGGGNEQGLHSREKAPDNPPQLVVTFGAG